MEGYIWSSEKENLFKFKKNLCISAGAGTGKTSVLVELYIRLLLSKTDYPYNLNVQDIVAITFTDKASEEMKRRIREAFNKLSKETSFSNEWQRKKRDLIYANISTFHKFCMRILSEFPVEAQIDPHFSILSEEESALLLEEAIDEVVYNSLDNKREEVVPFIKLYTLKGVKENLKKIYLKISTWGLNKKEIKNLIDKTKNNSISLYHSELKQFYENLSNFYNFVKDYKTNRTEDEKIIFLEENLSIFKNLNNLDPEKLNNLTENIKKFRFQNENFKLLKKLLNDSIEKVIQLHNYINSYELNISFLNLLDDVSSCYKKNKEKRSQLDFDDLLIKARNLLRDYLEIREYYKDKFKVIMIDEFQDTNDLQREIIYYLTEESGKTSKIDELCRYDEVINLEKQKLFIVGDPKQSIYKFRGADVSVFFKMMEKMDEKISDSEKLGEVIYFQENYRSRKGILDFVNDFFEGITENSNDQKYYKFIFNENDKLIPQRVTPNEWPLVEIIKINSEGSLEEKRKIEAETICKRILRLISDSNLYIKTENGKEEKTKPKFKDIAILFRRFTKIKIYENEFRKFKIPYYVVKGTGFYNSREIRDLLNFLKIINNPYDKISLVSVLRSPMVSISDETLLSLTYPDGKNLHNISQLFIEDPLIIPENVNLNEREKLYSFHKLILEIRKLKDQLNLSEILQKIVLETNYSLILLTLFQGIQKISNIRKLIDIAREFQKRRVNSLKDFINHIEKLTKEEPKEPEAQISSESDDVVRLMTIHQAKGLEFPIVFVPDIGHKRNRESDYIIFDEEYGVIVKKKEENSKNYFFQKAYDRENKKEIEETKRLLYVALTRAKDYLIISGETSKNTSKEGNWRVWLDSYLMNSNNKEKYVKVINHEEIEEISKEELKNLYSIYPEIQNLKPLTNIEISNNKEIETILNRTFNPPNIKFKEITLTTTSLNEYIICPRRYYYIYKLNLQELPYSILWEEEEDRTNRVITAIEKGNLAHLILEHIDFSESEGNISSLIDQILISKGYLLKSHEIMQLKIDILQFLKSNYGIMMSKLDKRQIYREVPFLLKLNDFDNNLNIYIKGVIDTLFQQDDNWVILDYKYAYLDEEQEKVEAYKFQLWIYTLAVIEEVKKNQVKAHIKFLRSQNIPPLDITPTQKELENFKYNLIKMSKEIAFYDVTQGEENLKIIPIEECKKIECGFWFRCHSN